MVTQSVQINGRMNAQTDGRINIPTGQTEIIINALPTQSGGKGIKNFHRVKK